MSGWPKGKSTHLRERASTVAGTLGCLLYLIVAVVVLGTLFGWGPSGPDEITAEQQLADLRVETTTTTSLATTTTTVTQISVTLAPSRLRWQEDQYGCHSDGRCLDDWGEWCDEDDLVWSNVAGEKVCPYTAEQLRETLEDDSFDEPYYWDLYDERDR